MNQQRGPRKTAQAWPISDLLHLPPPGEPIYLTDRSGAETDDKCGMRFWLNRKEGGRGIVPKEEPTALLVGRATHEDLATIAGMADISVEALQEICQDIISGITPEDKEIVWKMELLYRRLGWLVAWAFYLEPRLRELWDTVAIEKEIVLDRTPLWVAVTPDRLLRSKHHKYLKYLEYKTTITAAKKWMESWNYQIQMHTSMAAVSEEMGEKVKFGQIVGLMKGYFSPSDQHLIHPYVWAYYKQSTGEWEHDYTKARGLEWKSMPVWEYPGGIVEWVQKLGVEVATLQFPHSAPIFQNSNMLNNWVTRRLAREKQIKQVEDICRTDHVTRQIFFPMIQSQCRPAFGDPCPYLMACWNASVAADPTRCPDYEPRQPHHDLEIIGVEV